jgi:hypothetical protein
MPARQRSMKESKDFPPLRKEVHCPHPHRAGRHGRGHLPVRTASACGQPGRRRGDLRCGHRLVNPPQPSQGYEEDCRGVLRREIRRARQLSPQGILGVNIMVGLTNYADMVRSPPRKASTSSSPARACPWTCPPAPGGAAHPAFAHRVFGPGRRGDLQALVLPHRPPARRGGGGGTQGRGHLGFSPEQIEGPELCPGAPGSAVVEALKPFEDKAGRAIHGHRPRGAATHRRGHPGAHGPGRGRGADGHPLRGHRGM